MTQKGDRYTYSGDFGMQNVSTCTRSQLLQAAKHQLPIQSLLAGSTPTHPRSHARAQSSHDLVFGNHEFNQHIEEDEVAQQDEHDYEHVAAHKPVMIHLAL